jgi:hypothetical protein
VTYATDAEPLEVGMRLVSSAGQPTYGFERFSDGSGAIHFELVADLYKPLPGVQRERLTIHSRWLATGAGRSDMKVTDGDLGPDQRDATECWDEAFRVVHSRPFDFAGEPEVGAPADCALQAQ